MNSHSVVYAPREHCRYHSTTTTKWTWNCCCQRCMKTDAGYQVLRPQNRSQALSRTVTIQVCKGKYTRLLTSKERVCSSCVKIPGTVKVTIDNSEGIKWCGLGPLTVEVYPSKAIEATNKILSYDCRWGTRLVSKRRGQFHVNGFVLPRITPPIWYVVKGMLMHSSVDFPNDF